MVIKNIVIKNLPGSSKKHSHNKHRVIKKLTVVIKNILVVIKMLGNNILVVIKMLGNTVHWYKNEQKTGTVVFRSRFSRIR